MRDAPLGEAVRLTYWAEVCLTAAGTVDFPYRRLTVMAGPVPAIATSAVPRQMAGTRPAMT
jgi:hypothetical protein